MTDPINELDGLLGRVRHGGMHQFTFSQKGDYSGIQAERLVRRYGVQVFRREADDADAGFSVKTSQADWAEYILLRAGVPVTSKLFNPQNAVYAQRHQPGSLPRAWGDGVAARGLIGWVLNALDGNISLASLGLPFVGILGALLLRGKRTGTTGTREPASRPRRSIASRPRKRRRGKPQRRGRLAELVGLVGLLAILGAVAVLAFGLATGG